MRIALFLICLGAASLAARQDSVAWEHRSQHDIKHFELVADGNLFLSTDRDVKVLDAQSGSVLWTRDDIRDCQYRQRSGWTAVTWQLNCSYGGRKGTTLDVLSAIAILGHSDQVAVVDLQTGRTVVDSREHKWGKIRGYDYLPSLGVLALLVESGRRQHELVIVPLREPGSAWFTGVPIREGLRWLGRSGDGGALVHGIGREGSSVLASLDLTGLHLHWQFSGTPSKGAPISRALPMSDAGWVARLGDEVVRFGREGEVRWRVSGLDGSGSIDLIQDQDRIYVAMDGDLLSLAADSGVLLWRHDTGTAPEILMHALGVLVASGGHLALLSRDTGAARWKVPLTASLATPRVVEDTRLHLASPTSVMTVQLDAGTVTHSARYLLEGAGEPAALHSFEGGFAVVSQQTFVLLDAKGSVKEQRNYPAVRESGLLAALRAPIVVGLALTAAAYNDTRGPMEPAAVVAVPSDFATPHTTVAGTPTAGGHSLFYTEQPAAGQDKYSFVRVDNATGLEAGRIALGDRNLNLYSGPPDNSRPAWEGVRRTNFYVHWPLQQISIKTSGKEIRVHRFPTSQ